MKFLKNTALLLIFFLFFSFSAEAKVKRTTFFSESWANATNEDGTGLYWDMFRKIYESNGVKFNYKIWSYTGAMKRVQAKKADAAVGAYVDEVDKVIYPKNHFAVDVVQVLYKKGTVKNWEEQKSIQGKKAGWIKGYGYDEYLDVKVEKVEFDTREQALKLLDAGRIDFYFDASGEIQGLVKDNKIDLNLYEIKTLFKLKLYVVFSQNQTGRELAAIFDDGINKMVKSGELKKLYDYYNKEKNAGLTYPF